MLKKLFAGALLVSAVLGTASARDMDFDRGAGVKKVQEDFRAEPEIAIPAMPDEPQTFTERNSGKVYPRGFVKKDLPASRWKSFKNEKTSVPDKLDLRPSLTQVENQGWCGSCWAFSLTATHRDGHSAAGKDPGRLSQEWLVDNSTYAAGCNGGYFDSANDFMLPKGQPLWSDCPYKDGSGKCPAIMPFAAHITAWYMLGDKETGPTVRDIEEYMTIYNRPVSIGVASSAGKWQSYGGGVYNACKMGELDHMINIVGWDNEGAIFNKDGNLPPGKGVWILRNSWGTSWGEKGYMRSKMTDAAGQRCNAVAQEAAAFEFPEDQGK